MKKENMMDKVWLARYCIKSGFFTEEQITELCKWLGFNDTAFRDKSSADKLKDFLLDYGYWLKRHKL